MSKISVLTNYEPAVTTDAQKWINDGWQMAAKEGEHVSESIALKHMAETKKYGAIEENLKIQGVTLLKRSDELGERLLEAGFNLAEYLKQKAQGVVDAFWAFGLFILNAALMLFVFLAFGFTPITILLAFLVMASCVSIEEFFQAYEEKNAFREGIFLTLSFVALASQFWLGSIRGLFLAAFSYTADVGPATHALKAAAIVLQYVLGSLSVVSETLCGYKLYCIRANLFSKTARAARERDNCNAKMTKLHSAIQLIKAEPEIRRDYRLIGARQYLYSVKSEQLLAQKMEPKRGMHHLKKAVIGALIALLALAAMIFFAPRAFAGQQSKNVIVLCDLTQSLSTASFQANIEGISGIINSLSYGDRLLIFGITDSFGNPAMLFDRTLPINNNYLDLQVKAAQEGMVSEWNNVSKGLRGKTKYKKSDILGAISLLPYMAGLSSQNAQNILIVFSDLRQCTPDLDLESVKRIPTDRVLPQLKGSGKIPRLNGYQVYLLGVDPNGKSADYFESLKDFWMKFFAESGAQVRSFSIDRHPPVL
jgi:hypothetical protein